MEVSTSCRWGKQVTHSSVIAKRKQASTPQDSPRTKKVHIEGQARDKMIWAGALYGQYVADGKHLLDFTEFAAAIPPSVPFDLTQVQVRYAAFLSFIIVAEGMWLSFSL